VSNCIELRNHVVTFPEDVIDVSKVRDLLARVPEQMPRWEEDPILYTAWWYMATCTTVTDSGVTIRFGCGRSSHTWRDFRQFANQVLLPLFRDGKTFTHRFQVEDDGFPGWGPWKVQFGKELK